MVSRCGKQTGKNRGWLIIKENDCEMAMGIDL